MEAFVDESNDSEVFEYAWDCENSAFHIQSENTQNLSIITPNNIDSTSCVIKVEHKNSVALDTFHIHIVQDRPSANAGNDTTIYRGEELMISGKNSIDSIGRIVEYQWDFSLEEVDYSILTNRVDTTIIFPNEMIEDIQFVLTVIDDDGQLDSDSLFVSTRLYTGIGVPIISATDSVDISINDEIEIELSVLDTLGDVVRIEYDLDGNGVVDSTSNDIGLFRFKWDDKTGVFNVKITAIDNDSNRASEIMVLSVYEDKPIAKAGNDQVIKRDSEIKLSAAESTDGYGEIIEFQWEYSINSDSHVIASESPDTGITLPKDFLGDIPVVLTVTDDDGLIGKDTVNIAVKLFFKVLTDAGPFAKRIYGQSIVFKDTLWIFGGKGTSVATLTPPHNDIWYSTDGENWNSDQFDSTFKPRYLHTVCEFNDKLWIIGGLSDNSQGYLNDVWSSSDGLNWELVTDSANFSARARHASVVYDDKIWVIGGLTGYWDSDTSYNNDVWSSVDGMNWVLESTGQFPGSGSHKVQAFNDHLFLFGTGHEFIGTGHVNGSLSGTYQSTDGKTWTQINDFQINSEFNMIPFLNTLWVVAGDVRSNNNMYQLNSELNWIKYDAYDLDYSNATGSSFAVFNDKIILMGGSIGGAGGGPVHGTNMIAIFE